MPSTPECRRSLRHRHLPLQNASGTRDHVNQVAMTQPRLGKIVGVHEHHVPPPRDAAIAIILARDGRVILVVAADGG